MPERVFRLYQRHKLININVNIATAGFLAILVAKYPVHLADGFIDSRLGLGHPLVKSIAAALIDGAADVVIYYVLHWLANHWRPYGRAQESDKPDDDRHFLRNATLVQFERLALSPIFYGVSIGLMWGVQHSTDIGVSWAFVLAFATGIVVTRVLHSIYMVRTGRVDVPRLSYLIEELTHVDINRDGVKGLPDSERPKPRDPAASAAADEQPISATRE
ncbi:MAG: hypothetical protein DYG94_08860 [Leptolyngbya sp. PLA3]|nr:MAG: hypothetical protein EDM82_02935 [Cyanobacteria bacterium CYA]MCE7968840.1 hypothetical protein [Leptolyngbya sp. PL-A3]